MANTLLITGGQPRPWPRWPQALPKRALPCGGFWVIFNPEWHERALSATPVGKTLATTEKGKGF